MVNFLISNSDLAGQLLLLNMVLLSFNAQRYSNEFGGTAVWFVVLTYILYQSGLVVPLSRLIHF